MSSYASAYRWGTLASQFSRPADTTAYAAGDTIAPSTTDSEAMVFDGATTAPGGVARIVHAKLVTNVVASTAQVDLVLFRIDNPRRSAVDGEYLGLDNSPLVFRQDNIEAYLGRVVFPAFGGTVIGTSDIAQSELAVDLPVTLFPDHTAIYGFLQARAGFTPVSGQYFRVELAVERPT